MELVNYGATYKQLRKQRRITLQQAADGIVDASTLSRWENGYGNMYFDNVVQLLNKLNIYYDEFVSIARGKEVETDWNLNDIFVAYNKENIDQLRKIINAWEQEYRKKHQEKLLFYLAAACSVDKTLTGMDHMPNDLKIKLNYIFKNVKQWGQYYTQHLGNCVEMIETRTLYVAGVAISAEIKEVSKVDLFRYTQDLDTILGAYFVLIKRDVNLAKKLQIKINKIAFPEQYMSLKITKDFLNELLQYRMINDYSTKKMDEIIAFLNKHDYPDLAHDLGMKFKSFLIEKTNLK